MVKCKGVKCWGSILGCPGVCLRVCILLTRLASPEIFLFKAWGGAGVKGRMSTGMCQCVSVFFYACFSVLPTLKTSFWLASPEMKRVGIRMSVAQSVVSAYAFPGPPTAVFRLGSAMTRLVS